MHARLITPADYRRMPWKNGGGVTTEIAVHGGGLDGFGWRLSIADIAQGGPFSVFAGCDRCITVIEGEGMTLAVDGDAPRALRRLQPFAFSGDSAVECALLGGPIRDFNVICDRDRWRARVQWLGGERLRCASPRLAAGHVLAFVLSGALRVRAGDEAWWTCGEGETLHLEGLEGPFVIEANGLAEVCLVEFQAVA